MPHPKEDENKKDFMKRCIPYLIHEGREQKQAIAICYSIWGKENKVGDTSQYQKLNKKQKIKLMYHHF